MMRQRISRALGVALVVALAGPMAAQAQGGQGTRATGDMFAGLSAEGRQIMSQAMMTGRNAGVGDQLKAAHEQVLALLSQPVVDRAALEKAMQAEDRIMIDQVQRQTDAMLKAFLLLSAADRQAWVANDRAMRSKMAQRRAGAPLP